MKFQFKLNNRSKLSIRLFPETTEDEELIVRNSEKSDDVDPVFFEVFGDAVNMWNKKAKLIGQPQFIAFPILACCDFKLIN